MLSRAVFWAAAAGLVALAAPARGAITLNNGQAVSLATVLASNDHQVNIGDKLFTFNAYTSSQFPVSSVFISGYIAANPNDGIGFDITGGFGDLFPGDINASTFDINYSVEVNAAALAQGYRIKDMSLVFNGAASGAGSYSRVLETASDPNGPPGNTLGGLLATVVPGGQTNQQAFLDFSPATYSRVNVEKNVQFFAVGPGDFASASFIRQSFSQRIVPGPGSVALFGLGAMLVIRRRR
ncbi:MAG TPA: hypothetical protein VHC70_05350 [Phycisphaerales bacterium]|jgi:hypothetical protein|nr:hypothetical protein [Phycisphaerales bacterium]